MVCGTSLKALEWRHWRQQLRRGLYASAHAQVTLRQCMSAMR